MWVIKAGDAEPLLIDDPTFPHWRSKGYREWQPDGGGGADGAPDADVAALLQDPESATSVAARAAFVATVGTSAAPVTDPGTARPSGDGPVYWVCANGVTPTNAADGDLIWNADA